MPPHSSPNKYISNKIVIIIATLLLLAVLALLAYGPVLSYFMDRDRESSINKGRNLYVELIAFSKDHEGLFPCDATGKSSTAEECFQQVITSNNLTDEELFWLKENSILGTTSRTKPNNNGILEPGENSWGYVKGLNSESNEDTPLIFDSAVQPGMFSTEVRDGKAIVVFLSGRAQMMDIGSHQGRKMKTGPVFETKEGFPERDIFSAATLPEGAQILVPNGK